MEFSPDLATIMRGTVTAFGADGVQRRVDDFGSGLKYCNAALLAPQQGYPSMPAGLITPPPPASPREEGDGSAPEQRVGALGRWLRDFFF